MPSLHDRVAKLAHEKPEFRAALVPLLKKYAAPGQERRLSPGEMEAAKAHHKDRKGTKGPGGYKFGEKIKYQGKDWLVYDFDAEGSGFTLILISPDHSTMVDGVPDPKTAGKDDKDPLVQAFDPLTNWERIEGAELEKAVGSVKLPGLSKWLTGEIDKVNRAFAEAAKQAEGLRTMGSHYIESGNLLKGAPLRTLQDFWESVQHSIDQIEEGLSAMEGLMKSVAETVRGADGIIKKWESSRRV